MQIVSTKWLKAGAFSLPFQILLNRYQGCGCIPDRYVPIKLCSPAFNTVENTSMLKHLVTTSNHFLLV